MEHGPSLGYVLEGVQTVEQEGRAATYGPGGAFFHSGTHSHSNLSDSAYRTLSFFALPASTPPDPASTLFETHELQGVRGGRYLMTLTQVEGYPGGSIPTHHHPGNTVGYVLQGTAEFHHEHGTDTYLPGSVFLEPAGLRHSPTIVGNTPFRAVAFRISPEGEPATVFTGAPAHPWTNK